MLQLSHSGWKVRSKHGTGEKSGSDCGALFEEPGLFRDANAFIMPRASLDKTSKRQNDKPKVIEY